MFYVNKHIRKYLLNEYKGSERKDTVILDDGYKYLLKMPDPTREENKKEFLNYINNVYSEYIGCHIASLMGFPVQETILGKYDTINHNGEEISKIVCLCKDVRNADEEMREFDTIFLSSDSNDNSITFSNEESIIKHIQKRLLLSKDVVNQIREFYYELFIFDAFVGNTDRHNGNIAILLNKNGEFSRISPIYDCGSCLLPLISDKELSNLQINSVAMSINSVICDEKKTKIRYDDFLLNNRNPNIDNALKKVICRINLQEIYNMIDDIDSISETRKEFYKQVLQIRYEKILIPALEKIYPLSSDKIPDNINLYQIFLDNIKQIANMEKNQRQTIQDMDIEIMRINKKYALCIKNNQCIGLLPIRSNNDAIRKAIVCLQNLNINIINEKLILTNPSKQENINRQGPDYEINL